MTVRITVVGRGKVGSALAAGLAAAGYVVRTPARGAEAAALTDAEVVVLAVPFGAVADLAALLRGRALSAVVVDCTNPVGPGLVHGLGSARSGSEALQALVPQAVVKAFSIYGHENLPGPAAGAPLRPVMMLAGDDAQACAVVAGLARDLGWEPLVTGGLQQALHLEHLTLLWIGLVRGGGHDPRLTWARLVDGAPA